MTSRCAASLHRSLDAAQFRLESSDFRSKVDFSSQLPRLSRGVAPLFGASASAATGWYSISDSFALHYDTHKTDHATQHDPSGAGVSFANAALQFSDKLPFVISGSDGYRHMSPYRPLLNQVVGAAGAESPASDQFAAQSGGNALVGEGSDHESGGFALQDGPADAYNEEAFQYFLEIERKRSELSNRPFLLMLVDFNKHPRIDAVTGEKLFSVLSLSLRETDFIGWYREGRVAGAVLTQHGEADGDHLSELVRARIEGALRQLLPPALASQLQARIYQIPPHSKPGSK
jgi:hypothetical protein